MKRILLVSASIITGGVAAVGIMAARYEPVIRPNVFVGQVPLGGLTVPEAEKKVRQWWFLERDVVITVESKKAKFGPQKLTLANLGLNLDDKATLSQLPTDSFVDSVQHSVGTTPEKLVIEPKFTWDSAKLKPISNAVLRKADSGSVARVYFRGGKIERVPENTGSELDLAAFQKIAMEAYRTQGVAEIPMKEGPKRIKDEDLEKITDVMAQFSTNFNAGMTSRCSNINLASGKLDGTVLMPGEIFSYNGTVGRRTVAAGFKQAPVLVDGRHEMGIGGGICQTSTTLYNAVVFSNLKVIERRNHSIPVPYVPPGRDATVDYNSTDFKFQNTMDFPIAIAREYKPGRLTFYVLGKKDKGLEIKIESGSVRSWGTGTRTIRDNSLPAGVTRVIERGSSGRSVTTYKITYRDGKQVSREVLHSSSYGGSPRIIARGTRVVAKPAVTAPSAAPAATTPPTTVAPTP